MAPLWMDPPAVRYCCWLCLRPSAPDSPALHRDDRSSLRLYRLSKRSTMRSGPISSGPASWTARYGWKQAPRAQRTRRMSQNCCCVSRCRRFPTRQELDHDRFAETRIQPLQRWVWWATRNWSRLDLAGAARSKWTRMASGLGSQPETAGGPRYGALCDQSGMESRSRYS